MTEISAAGYGDGRSTSSRDALSAVLRCDLSTIPPYLLLSREDDDDVRDIGKHDLRLVLLHPMLSNAKQFPSFPL